MAFQEQTPDTRSNDGALVSGALFQVLHWKEGMACDTMSANLDVLRMLLVSMMLHVWPCAWHVALQLWPGSERDQLGMVLLASCKRQSVGIDDQTQYYGQDAAPFIHAAAQGKREREPMADGRKV